MTAEIAEVERAKAFLREVRALCQKHGLSLAGGGYDVLEVWPLKPGEGGLHFSGVELGGIDIDLDEH